MRTLLAAAVLTMGMQAAHAYSPLQLDASPDAAPRRVVNIVFADYLAARPGTQTETAMVDLDNDGTAEIVARFVHTSSCREGMQECRTVILRHDRRSWGIVFDRLAETLEVSGHDLMIPAPVRAGGAEWKWDAGRYAPVGGGFGKPVSFEPVPAEHAAAYAVAFGPGAVKLAEGRYGVRFETSFQPLSDGVDTMILKMDGTVACGEVTGCPLRVLRKGEDGWSTVLSTSIKEGITVADTVRGGYRDIVVSTPTGYAVMGWNGTTYSVADRIEAVER